MEMWLVTSFLSALFIAMSIVAKRLTFNRHGGFWEVFYFSYIVQLAMLTILLVPSFAYFGLPSLKQIEYSFLFGLLSNTFTTVLYSYSIRECGSVISSSASLSVEPVLAVLLGSIVVNEKVGLNVIIASLLFPVIAYLIYLGGREGANARSCGVKSLIGVFTGASASFLSVLYSLLSLGGLVVNPFLVSFLGKVAGITVFFPVAWRKGAVSVRAFSGVPKLIYVSVLFGVLGTVFKFISLSYGVPGHATSIILLYPAIATVITAIVKETLESINKYTLTAVLLATINGFLVGYSD